MTAGTTTGGTVLAAGALVWRETADRGIEVCLVHRPKYDDWSLPKGKVAAGEHLLACAVREVKEETGHDVVLGRPLPPQVYDVDGRPKRVSYWLAEAAPSAPPRAPDAEIDDVAFVAVPEAISLLTHQRDADLVAAAVGGPLRTTPLVLVRHTEAKRRHEWAGPDSDRPLSARGAADAVALTAPLMTLGARRIIASDTVRCVDTVLPLARQLRIEVEREPRLSEASLADAEAQAPHPAVSLVRELLRDDEGVIVCSHRPLFPILFDAVGVDPPPAMSPGAFLVVHHRDGDVVATDHHQL